MERSETGNDDVEPVRNGHSPHVDDSRNHPQQRQNSFQNLNERPVNRGRYH